MAMINDKPTCDGCQQEMKLAKRLKNCKTTKGKEYRVRRFHCDTCDLDKTIFADGTRDERQYDWEEQRAIEEMKSRKYEEKIDRQLESEFIPITQS